MSIPVLKVVVADASYIVKSYNYNDPSLSSVLDMIFSSVDENGLPESVFHAIKICVGLIKQDAEKRQYLGMKTSKADEIVAFDNSRWEVVNTPMTIRVVRMSDEEVAILNKNLLHDDLPFSDGYQSLINALSTSEPSLEQMGYEHPKVTEAGIEFYVECILKPLLKIPVI